VVFVSDEIAIPVKMFWKADSTFEASSADVSIKDRWLSAKEIYGSDMAVREAARGKLTGKLFGLLRANRPQVLQIALVAHKHDNNIVISMIPQLRQPPCNVDVCRLLRNVVNKESANCASIVAKR